MMTAKTSFLAKVSCGLSIAVLAIAFTSGISTVRAEPETLAPSWREMFVNPILDAVKAVEHRLSSLEAKADLFGWSFTSRQITAHELCVADDAGARTCISKAQLDGLLKLMQAAAIEQPATIADSVIGSKDQVQRAEVAPAVPATGTPALDGLAEIETTVVTTDVPRPAAIAAQATLAKDTLDQDPAHTGSVPESRVFSSHAVIIYPVVEIIIPSTDR